LEPPRALPRTGQDAAPSRPKSPATPKAWPAGAPAAASPAGATPPRALTSQQLERIRENRRQALLRRAQRTNDRTAEASERAEAPASTSAEAPPPAAGEASAPADVPPVAMSMPPVAGEAPAEASLPPVAGQASAQPPAEAPPVDPPGAGEHLRTHPQCIICQDDMVHKQARLALPCGHVYHEECIRKYADCKNCLLEYACVFRCLQMPEVAERAIDMSQESTERTPPPENADTPAADLDSDLDALVGEAMVDAELLGGST